jgi:hypothetical protein
MFTAIRAETAHSPTYQLLRGELKKRGGRSPKPRNQVIAGGQSVLQPTEQDLCLRTGIHSTMLCLFLACFSGLRT